MARYVAAVIVIKKLLNVPMHDQMNFPAIISRVLQCHTILSHLHLPASNNILISMNAYSDILFMHAADL